MGRQGEMAEPAKDGVVTNPFPTPALPCLLDNIRPKILHAGAGEQLFKLLAGHIVLNRQREWLPDVQLVVAVAQLMVEPTVKLRDRAIDNDGEMSSQEYD